MKDRMEIQQLKKMGKRELVRLVQDCDDENRKLADENGKKQSRIQELEQQIAGLQGQMANMEEKRKEMQIRHQEPGSLADSMIQVNGVIEAAQNAAKQYLERIREMETAKQKEAEEVMEMAQHEAERIIAKAKTGAAQIKEASTNVLQSLQMEIDRMLGSARSEYEQRIVSEMPVPGAEVYVNADIQQKNFAEPGHETVPRLNDILYSAEAQRMEETKEQAFTEPAKTAMQEEKSADMNAHMPMGDKPPIETEKLTAEEGDFVEGLSDEIKSVINDLTYKTQHLGEQL